MASLKHRMCTSSAKSVCHPLAIFPVACRQECAKSATPWRTVKCFADNDLMGLSAKPPRVTSFERKLQIMGNLLAPKRYAVWQDGAGRMMRIGFPCPSLAPSFEVRDQINWE